MSVYDKVVPDKTYGFEEGAQNAAQNAALENEAQTKVQHTMNTLYGGKNLKSLKLNKLFKNLFKNKKSIKSKNKSIRNKSIRNKSKKYKSRKYKSKKYKSKKYKSRKYKLNKGGGKGKNK
jgi:hypothetical protein